MKKALFIQLAMVLITASTFGQSNFYDVYPVEGNGLRFWASDNYKIHMGNSNEYHLGSVVTDYSIKMNMSSNTGRGWTWGVAGATPIAALNNIGNMQIVGTFTSGLLDISNTNSDLSIVKLRNTNWTCNQRTAIEFWNGGLKNYPTSRIVSQMDGCANDGEALLFETQTAGQTSPSAKLMIKNNGNIGIGTTSPGQKLEVNGSILQRAENSAMGIDDGTNARLGFFKKSGYWPLIASGNNTPFVFAHTSEAGIHTNIASATLTERMRIDVNGNVGIGTSTPATRLHLNGAVRIDGASGGTIGSGNGSRIDLSSGGTTSIEENWGINLVGNDESPIKVRNAALLVGYTSSSAGWGTGGNLLVQGNVGIGTTTPDSKLTVKGDIHTREVKVDLNGAVGPDYVFEKDYDLLSLSELETYITQHKHLPEVPSAKEMEANGLNLKEMNLLLLKKVEELTLHLIEQNKKIDEQNQVIIKQNDRLTKLEKSN